MKKSILIASATAFVLGVGAAGMAMAGPHDTLKFADYPNNCLSCHNGGAGGSQYAQMFASNHYKWMGAVTEMVNGPSQQGKNSPTNPATNGSGMNSYCINILGDWAACGACHVGRGIQPGNGDTVANVDCLVCHNEAYALARVRKADGTMGVATPTDAMVQQIAKPTTKVCLNCHAKAGGGDAVKRGDLSVATGTNTSATFDVHMNNASTNSNGKLSCQKCHVFKDHRVIGKGSDLRVTDDLTRGAEVKCITCHTNKNTTTGHGTTSTQLKIGRHASKNVACQTCHIPTYAKVATETHRDWRYHHDGTPADGVSGPGHPYRATAANLIPEYMWWNRKSDNALLHDDATRTYDAALNIYPTSRPQGGFMNGKIYPFKYKTALQPKIVGANKLLAVDTFEYLKVSGNIQTSIEKGLVNMGYASTTPWEWVTTDTYQLINHGVEPKTSALSCGTNKCHDGTGHTVTGRMPFGELGYHTVPAKVKSCTLCHSSKTLSWEGMHDKHRTKIKTCQGCHVKEPTGLIEPATSSGLCNNCHSGKSYSSSMLQDIHKEHTEKYACVSCHKF